MSRPVAPGPLRLSARLESPLVLGLVVALLAASRWMAALGEPLATAVNPTGIIGFELAGTSARAAAILASWDEAAHEAMRLQTRWDTLLYVPLYVVTLSAWASWCVRRLPSGSMTRIGIALAWAMLAAGLLDWLENAQLVAQLEHGPSGGRAAVAAAAAGIKFAILIATLVFTFAGTARVAIRRARGRRA